MSNSPYNIVFDFEKAIAEFAGSPYAVAVDTCTAAIQLSLEYYIQQGLESKLLPDRAGSGPVILVPAFTFCGVPAVVAAIGCRILFDPAPWEGEYTLLPSPVVDSACRFRRGMYKAGTFRCLSFQYRKHLPIGRGGMILTDNADAVRWFRARRALGRDFANLDAASAAQVLPHMLGYQMNMEPERAARGLSLLQMYDHNNQADKVHQYHDLRKAPAFKPYSHC